MSTSKRQRSTSSDDEDVQLTNIVGFLQESQKQKAALKKELNAVLEAKEKALQEIEHLKVEKEELNARISSLEQDAAKLYEDIKYWKDAYEKSKDEKDEMEVRTCRPLVQRNTELSNLVAHLQEGVHGCNVMLETKDTHIANLTNALTGVKQQLITAKDRIKSIQSESDEIKNQRLEESTRLRELEAASQQDKEALSGLRAQYDALKTKAAKQSTTITNLRRDIDGHKASTTENEGLKSKNSELECVIDGMKRRFKDVEFLFHDIKSGNDDSTGVLIKTGVMLSLQNILNQWKDADGFDGSPNFPIRCEVTRAVTSVVMERAAFTFTGELAKHLAPSLKALPHLHFKYIDQGSQWTTYSLHDQLMLSSKLVLLLKTDHVEKFITIHLEDTWHIVTMAYSKHPSTNARTTKISLRKMTEDGEFRKLRIELVDPPVDETQPSTFLPVDFNVVCD